MLIIDTNILLELRHVNLLEELMKFFHYGEPVVTLTTIEELKKIRKKEAKLALDFIATSGIKVIKTKEESADKAILSVAKPGKDAVVTNDRKLIKALKKKNIKVIRLRQRKYLVEE